MNKVRPVYSIHQPDGWHILSYIKEALKELPSKVVANAVHDLRIIIIIALAILAMVFIAGRLTSHSDP